MNNLKSDFMTAEETEIPAKSAASLQHDDLLAPDDSTVFESVNRARRTQLNIALQLLHAGDQVLLLQAATGMGTNAFLLGLMQQELDIMLIRRVIATAHLDCRDLFAAFVADDLPADAPTEILRTAARQGLQPALLIDAADQLSDTVLTELLALWAAARANGTAFGLLLAGLPGLQERLADSGALPLDCLHTIKLHPLSERQTLDYLTDYLDAAGLLSMNLVAEAEMRAIHARTGGVPALIDQAVRQLLNGRMGRSRPASPPRASSGRRTIALVTAALAVLVAALVGALQYTERQRPAGPSAEAETPPSAVMIPAERAPALSEAIPPVALSDESEVAETAELPVDPEEAPESAAHPLPDKPVAAIEAESVSEPQPALTEQQPPPGAEPAESLEAAQNTPAPAAYRDNTWLADRQAARFTIQLIAANDAKALASFMVQHELAEQAALLTVQRNGRDWHIVVLGDYPSRDAGRAALQELPATLRQDGAWIRSFGEIQELAP